MLLGLEKTTEQVEIYNVGSEDQIDVKTIAETLTKLYEKPNFQPYLSNEYRKGDIRHCYADTTKAQNLLDFKPTVALEDGLTELAKWTKTHGW